MVFAARRKSLAAGGCPSSSFHLSRPGPREERTPKSNYRARLPPWQDSLCDTGCLSSWELMIQILLFGRRTDIRIRGDVEFTSCLAVFWYGFSVVSDAVMPGGLRRSF